MSNPAPYDMSGYVIVNRYGTIWTPCLFSTPEAAYRHLETFWSGSGDLKILKEFKIAQANSKVELRLGGNGKPLFVKPQQLDTHQ